MSSIEQARALFKRTNWQIEAFKELTPNLCAARVKSKTGDFYVIACGTAYISVYPSELPALADWIEEARRNNFFYVVDNYTHTIEGQYKSREIAEQYITDLHRETGLSIWTIYEARDREDLYNILPPLE